MKYLVIVLTTLLCFFAKEGSAQPYPITSIVNLTTPNVPRLDAYTVKANNPLMVTLISNDLTKPSYDVRLRLTISGEGISLRTSDFFMPRSIRLGYNVPVTLTGADLGDYFDPNNLEFKGISKQDYLKYGKLPEGMYSICIEALDFRRDRELPVSNRSCAMGLVQEHDPPVILTPIGEQIASTPNFTYFSWQPQHIGAFPVEYELKIYEVIPGLTPDQVITFTPPVVTKYTTIPAYQYTPVDPFLHPWQKYIMQVKVRDIQGNNFFKNEGASRIEEFVLVQEMIVKKEKKVEVLMPLKTLALNVKNQSLSGPLRIQWCVSSNRTRIYYYKEDGGNINSQVISENDNVENDFVKDILLHEYKNKFCDDDPIISLSRELTATGCPKQITYNYTIDDCSGHNGNYQITVESYRVGCEGDFDNDGIDNCDDGCPLIEGSPGVACNLDDPCNNGIVDANCNCVVTPNCVYTKNNFPSSTVQLYWGKSMDIQGNCNQIGLRKSGDAKVYANHIEDPSATQLETQEQAGIIEYTSYNNITIDGCGEVDISIEKQTSSSICAAIYNVVYTITCNGSTNEETFSVNIIQPDSDCDGECDQNDHCPNNPKDVGDTCDDGNPNTTNDQINIDCECAGTILLDSDNDGTHDDLDACPNNPFIQNNNQVCGCCKATNITLKRGNTTISNDHQFNIKWSCINNTQARLEEPSSEILITKSKTYLRGTTSNTPNTTITEQAEIKKWLEEIISADDGCTESPSVTVGTVTSTISDDDCIKTYTVAISSSRVNSSNSVCNSASKTVKINVEKFDQTSPAINLSNDLASENFTDRIEIQWTCSATNGNQLQYTKPDDSVIDITYSGNPDTDNLIDLEGDALKAWLDINITSPAVCNDAPNINIGNVTHPTSTDNCYNYYDIVISSTDNCGNTGTATVKFKVTKFKNTNLTIVKENSDFLLATWTCDSGSNPRVSKLKIIYNGVEEEIAEISADATLDATKTVERNALEKWLEDTTAGTNNTIVSNTCGRAITLDASISAITGGNENGCSPRVYTNIDVTAKDGCNNEASLSITDRMKIHVNDFSRLKTTLANIPTTQTWQWKCKANGILLKEVDTAGTESGDIASDMPTKDSSPETIEAIEKAAIEDWLNDKNARGIQVIGGSCSEELEYVVKEVVREVNSSTCRSNYTATIYGQDDCGNTSDDYTIDFNIDDFSREEPTFDNPPPATLNWAWDCTNGTIIDKDNNDAVIATGNFSSTPADELPDDATVRAEEERIIQEWLENQSITASSECSTSSTDLIIDFIIPASTASRCLTPYEVEIQATDNCGNEATYELLVNIEDYDRKEPSINSKDITLGWLRLDEDSEDFLSEDAEDPLSLLISGGWMPILAYTEPEANSLTLEQIRIEELNAIKDVITFNDFCTVIEDLEITIEASEVEVTGNNEWSCTTNYDVTVTAEDICGNIAIKVIPINVTMEYDGDADKVCDQIDTCPDVANTGEDLDEDNIDDACDICPSDENNIDSDGNGIGDACESLASPIIAPADGESICFPNSVLIDWEREDDAYFKPTYTVTIEEIGAAPTANANNQANSNRVITNGSSLAEMELLHQQSLAYQALMKEQVAEQRALSKTIAEEQKACEEKITKTQADFAAQQIQEKNNFNAKVAAKIEACNGDEVEKRKLHEEQLAQDQQIFKKAQQQAANQFQQDQAQQLAALEQENQAKLKQLEQQYQKQQADIEQQKEACLKGAEDRGNKEAEIEAAYQECLKKNQSGGQNNNGGVLSPTDKKDLLDQQKKLSKEIKTLTRRKQTDTVPFTTANEALQEVQSNLDNNSLLSNGLLQNQCDLAREIQLKQLASGLGLGKNSNDCINEANNALNLLKSTFEQEQRGLKQQNDNALTNLKKQLDKAADKFRAEQKKALNDFNRLQDKKRKDFAKDKIDCNQIVTEQQKSFLQQQAQAKEELEASVQSRQQECRQLPAQLSKDLAAKHLLAREKLVDQHQAAYREFKANAIDKTEESTTNNETANKSNNTPISITKTTEGETTEVTVGPADGLIVGKEYEVIVKIEDPTGKHFFGDTGENYSYTEKITFIYTDIGCDENEYPAPIAIDATDVSTEGFTANWEWESDLVVERYFVQVALDPDFNELLPGYQGSFVDGQTTTYLEVNTSLDPEQIYYYRVQAVNRATISPYSNVIEVDPCDEELVMTVREEDPNTPICDYCFSPQGEQEIQYSFIQSIDVTTSSNNSIVDLSIESEFSFPYETVENSSNGNADLTQLANDLSTWLSANEYTGSAKITNNVCSNEGIEIFVDNANVEFGAVTMLEPSDSSEEDFSFSRKNCLRPWNGYYTVSANIINEQGQCDNPDYSWETNENTASITLAGHSNVGVTITCEDGCVYTDTDDLLCVVGTPCDDDDDCTEGDVFDEDCNCVGTSNDADGDGVLDGCDVCPDADDTIHGVDSDGDGVPDCLEDPEDIEPCSTEANIIIDVKVDYRKYTIAPNCSYQVIIPPTANNCNNTVSTIEVQEPGKKSTSLNFGNPDSGNPNSGYFYYSDQACEYTNGENLIEQLSTEINQWLVDNSYNGYAEIKRNFVEGRNQGYQLDIFSTNVKFINITYDNGVSNPEMFIRLQPVPFERTGCEESPNHPYYHLTARINDGTCDNPTFQWSNGQLTNKITTSASDYENHSVIITCDNGCSYDSEVSLICYTGNPCDDGDACTENDVFDDDCNCSGTFIDNDQDGVCDAEDICEGHDDNIDPDTDGIPSGCDSCPEGPNDIDEDEDGVPDGCDDIIQACTASLIIEEEEVSERQKCNYEVNLTNNNRELLINKIEIINNGNTTLDGTNTTFRFPYCVKLDEECSGANYSSKDELLEDINNWLIANDYGGTAEINVIPPSDPNDSPVLTFQIFNTSINFSSINISQSGKKSNRDFYQQCFREFLSTEKEISVDINGLCDNPTYLWDNGATTSSIRVETSNTTYSVTVTCEDGCSYDSEYSTLCTVGVSCDDGDDCTENDVKDENCNCVGTLRDADDDGVCDDDDVCPNGDDNEDADNDGVPDSCDQCEGFDDNIDSDRDGIPDACDTVEEECTASLIITPLPAQEPTCNYCIPTHFDDAQCPEFIQVLEVTLPDATTSISFDTNNDAGGIFNFPYCVPSSVGDCSTEVAAIRDFEADLRSWLSSQNLSGTVIYDPEGQCDPSLTPAQSINILVQNTSVVFEGIIISGCGEQVQQSNIVVSNCTQPTSTNDQVQVTVNGNCNNATYQWQEGSTSTTNISEVAGDGTFAVTVTCDNGCVYTSEDDGLCEVGEMCDDYDSCTIDDKYNADCICVGTYDETQCDDTSPDPCPADIVGTACDDGNDCTENDVYNSECYCEGTSTDTDGDGVCDANDVCPQGDDNIDTDGDGIPDACDPTITCDGAEISYCEYISNLANCPDNIVNDLVQVSEFYRQIAAGSFDDSDTQTTGTTTTEDESVSDINNEQALNEAGVKTEYDNFNQIAENINGTWVLVDDDGDGICNLFDLLPTDPDNTDSNNNGVADKWEDCLIPIVPPPSAEEYAVVITALFENERFSTDGCLEIMNCNCDWEKAEGGDKDGDGICDFNDICPEGDDRLDSDGDGIPDACDIDTYDCQDAPCDDGDPCTAGDREYYNPETGTCICEGFPMDDTDGDGICDDNDICPEGDDEVDNDTDDIPDACDTCPNMAGQIGSPCDDDNACTVDDKLNDACECKGIYLDSDNDGVCDAEDACEGFPDPIDLDGDGINDLYDYNDNDIPDGCDPPYYDIPCPKEVRFLTGAFQGIILVFEDIDATEENLPDPVSFDFLGQDENGDAISLVFENQALSATQTGVSGDGSGTELQLLYRIPDLDFSQVDDPAGDGTYAYTGKVAYSLGQTCSFIHTPSGGATPIGMRPFQCPDIDLFSLENNSFLFGFATDADLIDESTIPDGFTADITFQTANSNLQLQSTNAVSGQSVENGDPLNNYLFNTDYTNTGIEDGDLLNPTGNITFTFSHDHLSDLTCKYDGTAIITESDCLDTQGNPTYPGAPCNDGDDKTSYDVYVYDAQVGTCECKGRVVHDLDDDGIHDDEDPCPTDNTADGCDCPSPAYASTQSEGTIKPRVDNGDDIEIAFDPANEHTTYKITWSPIDPDDELDSDGNLVPITTETDFATIANRIPGNTYTLSITGICPTGVESPVLTAEVEIPLSENECGPPNLVERGTNCTPLDNLSIGDEIKVGSFTVIVADVTSGSGGIFSGSGYTEVAYFNRARVNMEFDGVTIESCDEGLFLTGGQMDVTGAGIQVISEDLADKLTGILSTLEDVSDLLSEVADALDALESIVESLQDLDDYFSSGHGPLTTLLDVIANTPYVDQDLIQDVQDAMDCMSEGTAAFETCKSDLDAAIEALLAELKRLYDADVQVLFEAYDNSNNNPSEVQKFGFDRQEYEVHQENYYQLEAIAEDPYSVAWKSVRSGDTDQVSAQKRPDDQLATNTTLTFEHNETDLGATADGDLYTMTVTGHPSHHGIEEIYAIQNIPASGSDHTDPNPDSTADDPLPEIATTEAHRHIAGKLNVISYDPKDVKLVLVPIGNVSLPPQADLAAQLNTIYNQAVMDINLSIYDQAFNPTLPTGDFPDLPSGWLSAYNSEMSSVINEFKDQADTDEDTYYLFVVDKQHENNLVGFMPKKRQFGFVFLGEVNAAAAAGTASADDILVKTIAHELGHGAFILEHTFETYDNPALEGQYSDNLMDYGADGVLLRKYQWDLIHDPASNFTLGDSDEEGQQTVVSASEFDKLDGYRNTFEKTNPDDPDDLAEGTFTFVAPSGKPITLPKDITSVTFNTGDQIGGEMGVACFEGFEILPFGTLRHFVWNEKNYTLQLDDCTRGDFLHYVQNDNLNEVYLDIYTPTFENLNTRKAIIGFPCFDEGKPIFQVGQIVMNAPIYTTSIFGTSNYKAAGDRQSFDFLVAQQGAVETQVEATPYPGYNDKAVQFLKRVGEGAKCGKITSLYAFVHAHQISEYPGFYRNCAGNFEILSTKGMYRHKFELTQSWMDALGQNDFEEYGEDWLSFEEINTWRSFDNSIYQKYSEFFGEGKLTEFLAEISDLTSTQEALRLANFLRIWLNEPCVFQDIEWAEREKIIRLLSNLELVEDNLIDSWYLIGDEEEEENLFVYIVRTTPKKDWANLLALFEETANGEEYYLYFNVIKKLHDGFNDNDPHGYENFATFMTEVVMGERYVTAELPITPMNGGVNGLNLVSNDGRELHELISLLYFPAHTNCSNDYEAHYTNTNGSDNRIFLVSNVHLSNCGLEEGDVEDASVQYYTYGRPFDYVPIFIQEDIQLNYNGGEVTYLKGGAVYVLPYCYADLLIKKIRTAQFNYNMRKTAFIISTALVPWARGASPLVATLIIGDAVVSGVGLFVIASPEYELEITGREDPIISKAIIEEWQKVETVWAVANAVELVKTGAYGAYRFDFTKVSAVYDRLRNAAQSTQQFYKQSGDLIDAIRSTRQLIKGTRLDKVEFRKYLEAQEAAIDVKRKTIFADANTTYPIKIDVEDYSLVYKVIDENVVIADGAFTTEGYYYIVPKLWEPANLPANTQKISELTSIRFRDYRQNGVGNGEVIVGDVDVYFHANHGYYFKLINVSNQNPTIALFDELFNIKKNWDWNLFQGDFENWVLGLNSEQRNQLYDILNNLPKGNTGQNTFAALKADMFDNTLPSNLSNESFISFLQQGDDLAEVESYISVYKYGKTMSTIAPRGYKSFLERITKFRKINKDHTEKLMRELTSTHIDRVFQKIDQLPKSISIKTNPRQTVNLLEDFLNKLASNPNLRCSPNCNYLIDNLNKVEADIINTWRLLSEEGHIGIRFDMDRLIAYRKAQNTTDIQQYVNRTNTRLDEAANLRANNRIDLAEMLEGSTRSTEYRTKMYDNVVTRIKSAGSSRDDFLSLYQYYRTDRTDLSSTPIYPLSDLQQLINDIDNSGLSKTQIVERLRIIFTGDWNAHHVLPANFLYNNNIVMDILEWSKQNSQTFDFNSIDNFIFIKNENHTGGSFGHNVYDSKLRTKTDELENYFISDPNHSDPNTPAKLVPTQEAYTEMLKLIESTQEKISEQIFNQNKKLDDLNF